MKPARIVVLLVALAAGGIAALLAGRSDRPAQIVQAPVAPLQTVDVLVASGDIGLGQPISAANLRWQTWPAEAASNGQFVTRNDKPDAMNQVAGSIARSPFFSGEPIREARLIKGQGSGYMAAILPAGMRAISTDVTPETGAAGFILPNDRVDVILSRRDKEAEKAAGVEVHTSETILSNVRVLAIDQTVEEKGGQRVVVGRTVTLELTQPQAERLVMSRTQGQLSLALRSLADAGGDKGEATGDRGGRRNGVNIVRYGVTTIQTPK
ncbi:MAG: Flp pilus assembly protein CpaB [Xanthobacteraceae bacterium]|nr:Flp pilus assembly protein CpaB [Xanthobacteraceae bacterium]MBX9829842.1 Flp pilus assembly protein CpaB [Xanthobacteraceae bacterium]